MEGHLNRIRNQKSSKLDNQKQIALTLEAVEETLKAQSQNTDDALNPASYFAVLMLLLEQEEGTSATGTAALYLLAIIFPSLSENLIKLKFSDILVTLVKILEEVKDNSAPDVKSILTCLEFTLKHSEPAYWNQSAVKTTFNLIHTLAIDPRPKVKKHAQEVIQNILLNNADTKANLVTQDFVNQQLNKYKKVSNIKQHTSSIMSLLSLIDCTISYWDQKQLLNLGEILVQLPKLSVNYITDKTYYILDKIFQTLTTGSDDLLSKLMERLVNAKPNANDVTNMAGWLKAIQNGFIKLLDCQPNLFFTLFYQLFDDFFKNELQGDYGVTNLKIGKCISEVIDSFDTSLKDAEPKGMQQIQHLEAMFKWCIDGLDYKFRFSFPSVLMAATSLVYQFGYDHPEWLIPLIQLLDQVRPMFQHKPELDLCLGACISILGASRFLTILPLNLDSASSSQIGRAWLLPLMKEHLQNTELSYFTNDILNGLMAKLQQKKKQFEQQERELEVKIYQTLIDQLWALFPGFCSYPTDLTMAFNDQFAEQIAQLIYSNPELRPFLFVGLSCLIDTNQELVDPNLSNKERNEKVNEYHIDPATAQANLTHLAKMSTNFLMVLFNVFTTVLPQHRAPLLKVLHSFLSITSSEDVNAAFDKVIQMLEHEAQNPQAVEPSQAGPTMSMMMMDLSSLMVPYLSQQNASSLTQACRFFITSPNDNGLHKKAYKLLIKLASSEKTQPIILPLLPELDAILLETSLSTPSAAKRSRLEFLSVHFSHIDSSRLHLIPALLPEVILSTKESNEKARIGAFSLLIGMANRMKQGGTIDLTKINPEASAEDPQTSEANLEEFVKMTLAGLTGSTPHMLSATISCLSRLFFEFMNQLPITLVQDVFESITLFEETQNREIIKPTIGLIKIICLGFDKDNLESYLHQIIKLLLHWSHNHKSQFRVRVRHIIERLVRKFGFEKLEPIFPQEHIKLLNNIKKRKLRAKRRAAADDEEHVATDEPTAQQIKASLGNAYEQALYGSDSEDSEADEPVAGTKRKIAEPASRKTGGQSNFLKTDHEDEDLVDFLDRSAISKISSFKPKSRHARNEARKVDNPFAADANGRMIIEDEEAPTKRKTDSDAMEVDEAPEEDFYKEHVESKEGFDRVNNRIKFRKAKPGQANDDFANEDDSILDATKSAKFRKGQAKSGNTVKIGNEYKARKAKGDVKKTGQLDPYAYIPLSAKMLPGTKGKPGPKMNIMNKTKKK